MKKIKWENITFLLITILGVVSLVHHIKLNGLYLDLIFEVAMYLIFALVGKYLVKDIRKNPSNWTL